jgi:broad specificity phosphatase PhoE
MTTLYLIRHGETEWNHIGRWQGQADVPLSDEGRAQARLLAQRLLREDVQFDQIYASDLSRAYETAQIVARALGMPIRTDRELREIDIGSWSGLTRPEITARFPGAFETVFYAPDGETRDQFAARTNGALLRIAETHPGQRLAIVSHGGVVRSMVKHLQNLARSQPGAVTIDAAMPPQPEATADVWGVMSLPVGNTSITEVRQEPNGWRLVRYSDVAHLEAVPGHDSGAHPLPNESSAV